MKLQILEDEDAPRDYQSAKRIRLNDCKNSPVVFVPPPPRQERARRQFNKNVPRGPDWTITGLVVFSPLGRILSVSTRMVEGREQSPSLAY